MLRIKPVPCILSCSQIRCWGQSLFRFFTTLQLLSKDHTTVKLAGKSGCLNQNCQFNDSRYKWESFWHNAFIYTGLERIYCTAHPGFMYKTFLLDKIVVHFPIKILRHFIKSKGNKGSLILFSTKTLPAWGSIMKHCSRKGWISTRSWSPASGTNSLYTRNLLAQPIWSRSGSWHHLPEPSKNTKNQDEMIQGRGLPLKQLGLPRFKKNLHKSTVCSPIWSSRSSMTVTLLGFPYMP